MTYKDMFYFGVLWLPALLLAVTVLVVAVKLKRFPLEAARGCGVTLELVPQNIGSLLPSPTRQNTRQMAYKLSVTCERYSRGTAAKTRATDYGQHSGLSSSKNAVRHTSTSLERIELNTKNLQDGGMKLSEVDKMNTCKQEQASKHLNQEGMEPVPMPRNTPRS